MSMAGHALVCTFNTIPAPCTDCMLTAAEQFFESITKRSNPVHAMQLASLLAAPLEPSAHKFWHIVEPSCRTRHRQKLPLPPAVSSVVDNAQFDIKCALAATHPLLRYHAGRQAHGSVAQQPALEVMPDCLSEAAWPVRPVSHTAGRAERALLVRFACSGLRRWRIPLRSTSFQLLQRD